MRRLALLLVAITALGQTQTNPRLVLLVVIDQMRADYFQRYTFTDGFKRLWDEGAVFTEARYAYASTKTAEAHALMLSGWSPNASGIISDAWYDRRTGATITAGAAPQHKLLDSTGQGGSPEQLLVHTVGDALKEMDPRSIVLTASWKRYSAILNGGQHADAAYWFDTVTGHMVTSDYYSNNYPLWVREFNHADLTAPYFGKTWLTHTLGTDSAPNEAYRTAFRQTPYANGVLLDFARTLIDKSGVGRDSDPDLVAISFSGLDYVGHQYGPETPEFDDTINALDHQIGDLLRTLDAEFGKGRYSLALTADHGAALNPEKEIARGHEAGRLNTQEFRKAVEQAVTSKLEIAGPIISYFESPELYLNYNAAATKGVSRSALDKAVVAAVEAQPGIAKAYTVDDILTAGASNDPYVKAVAEGYYADRSGDIHVLVKPNYIFWGGSGTTHGTPYEYDAHVPLILFGAGIKQGKYDAKTRINDLAPTIGKLLGVPYKGDPKGHVLSEALQQ